MKLRSIHTLFLLCIYLGINAQQNICNHTYHIGDKIERQQATFKHFDQKGKGAIWDLTDINLFQWICHIFRVSIFSYLWNI